MNRKERRRMEKHLGLTKVRQNETREEKFKRYHDSVQSGKLKEAEMKENRRLLENQEDDKKQSVDIASKATELMITKGLSYIEALEEAKKLLAEPEEAEK